MVRSLLLSIVVLGGWPPAIAQRPPLSPACPCGGYGPFPCAVTTLVALPDQAAALGLTSAQADTLRALREAHLDVFHEMIGEVGALVTAVHELGRPYDVVEAFALFYDLGGHLSEMEDDVRIAESSLLNVLDDRQRARWTALVAVAASYQEAPPPAPLAVPECVSSW